VAEEQAPAVENEQQDTPIAEDPASTQDTPESEEPSVNFEKRYDDLRYFNDRREQLIGAARQGDREAIDELGLPVAEEEETEDYTDDEDDYKDPFDRRLAQVEAQQQAQGEAEEEAEIEALQEQYLDDNFANFEEEENVKLSDEQKQLIASMAFNRQDENRVPDLETAFALWKEAAKGVRSGYEKSKRASRAPSGQKGERHVELDTPEKMAQALADEMDAEIDASA
jgi:hypothetical protein